MVNGMLRHCATRFAGNAGRSGAEHVQSERGFRPDRDGHAQVLIKEEAHLICGENNLLSGGTGRILPDGLKVRPTELGVSFQ